MIKGFKQFNEEKVKEVTFTFGRFNPPTTGHGKLLAKVAANAIGNSYRIYASHSNDAKRNPLEYKEKIKVMRKMFPKHGRNIIENKKLVNVFYIATDLYKEGFTKITMVVGSDRIKEFQQILKKYNGVKGKHGFYDFADGIEVVSAGERDPDSDDVSGMSASKMRKAATDGDFKQFMVGIPKEYGKGMTLFNLIRKRMGLKEKNNFREHVELPTFSSKREKYIAGEIFNEGDTAYVNGETPIVIKHKKSNYIITEDNDKYFIHSLYEKLNKTYGKGLAKSTKAKRQAQFNKQAKMDDDDPKAYKPAPGDTKSKTKLSKHTKNYRKMFGEFLMDEDPCWDSHKQVGMKKKGKKLVPNCVPKNEYYEQGKNPKQYKKATPGEVDEGKGKSETWEAGFKRRVVKTTKPEHLEKGFKWRIKGKDRNEISIKLYKTKPDFKEYTKQMKRVAGHEFGG
jgi:hypothetical protein